MKKNILFLLFSCVLLTTQSAKAIEGEYVDKNGHTWLYRTTPYGKEAEITGFNYKLAWSAEFDDVDVSKVYEHNHQERHNIYYMPETIQIEGESYEVTGIADRAFKDNKSILNMIIGSNIETIGEEAFAGCDNLERIIIPKNVKKIGKKAFKDCKLKGFSIEQFIYDNYVIPDLDSVFLDYDVDKIVFSLPKHLVNQYFKKYPELFEDYAIISLKSVYLSIPMFASYEKLDLLEEYHGIAKTNQQSFIVKKGKFVELVWHNSVPYLIYPYFKDRKAIWDVPHTDWPSLDGVIIPYIDLYGLRQIYPHDSMPCTPCLDIPIIDKDVYDFRVTTFDQWIPESVESILEDTNENESEIYNLEGKKINIDKDDIQQLPHGIYILKSKKGVSKIIL